MHRKNVLLRHDIVHYGEYALLYLSGISRTCYQDKLLLIIYKYGSFGVRIVYLRNALEARCDNECEIRLAVILKLLLRRTDKQLMDEQVLACQLVYDPELCGACGICSGKAVEQIYLSVLEISGKLGLKGVKRLL